MDSPKNVTEVLLRWRGGDPEALNVLMPLVYDELRRLARAYLRREHGARTLQTTALVHEAYLRLVDQTCVDWKNRAHFFGVAAHLMREILVDHARRRQAGKRGGGALKISLDDRIGKRDARDADLLALDEALDRLSTMDPQQSRIVELRYFTGLSVEEAAEAVGMSPATVKREWRSARIWLYNELTRK
jgi:RNA polymerase sigma factor (TIGR02999 family)